MEELAKEVEKIFSQFFVECQGNRLNQFAWSSFGQIVLNTIKNYKPKSEVTKDVKK